MKKTSIFAAALLALATQAQAAQYLGAEGQAQVNASFATASQLFFDLDFAKIGSTTLNFSVEADDLSQPLLSFNALVRNLSGQGFEAVSVQLKGASFAAPVGSISTDGFQPVLARGSNSQSLWAQFAKPGVTTEFYLGNPLLQNGASDWTLDLTGAQVGDTFSISVAVPEPESYALMLSGLALVGWLARRRRAVA
ncbi:PEP-CTERM sorting domain-containing protein [Roseateles sp.]|uniref:PEP-CTERM sorting domain-containing protein n=1 Tax=Roseateles sp. TaxID=1971397 RepID=UPI003BA53777